MILKNETDYLRLYPPRPTATANPQEITRIKGYVGQYKYNDIRVLINIFPKSGVQLRTRRREPLKEYVLPLSQRQEFRSLGLDLQRHQVLDGGVMRYLKIRNSRPIILWDILVHNDKYLVGTTYKERYELLRKILGEPKQYETLTGRRIGLKITETIWLAPIFREGFQKHYDTAKEADYLEGLILKAPNAKLEPGFVEENNTRWQIKLRKPRTDYTY